MGSPCLFTHRQALKMGYSAAQIYANYAYAYYTSVFCIYVYINTRTYVRVYAHIYRYIRAYNYVSLLCIPIGFFM